jgi:hypothetical protein
VADDQHLEAIDGGVDSGTPVFGRRSTPFDQRKYRTFGIEIESDSERWVETFSAYFDPDAGAILGLMNARTEWQQANATAVLLGTSLRDDDGVPDDWSSPTEPEYDDDGELLRLPEDDPDVSPPPRYEWHDGELLTEAELRDAIDEFDVLAEGSSRRRFGWIMQSPRHRVQLSALTDLADWIIGDAAKRPPRRPTSSARGRSQTSRTSGARRH